MPLLNPLSCQPIAAASEGDTPLAAAALWIVPAPTRAGVGSGPACGTTVAAGAGCDARTGAGAPAGSLITVPASSTLFGSRPFIAAIAGSGTRAPAARPDSVSPGRTVYAPCGAGAAVAGAAAGAAACGVAATRPAFCSEA